MGAPFKENKCSLQFMKKNLQVLQLFLDPDLDLDRDGWPTLLAVDLWRCSPLHRAAESGKTEVCFDFFLGWIGCEDRKVGESYWKFWFVD